MCFRCFVLKIVIFGFTCLLPKLICMFRSITENNQAVCWFQKPEIQSCFYFETSNKYVKDSQVPPLDRTTYYYEHPAILKSRTKTIAIINRIAIQPPRHYGIAFEMPYNSAYGHACTRSELNFEMQLQYIMWLATGKPKWRYCNKDLIASRIYQKTYRERENGFHWAYFIKSSLGQHVSSIVEVLNAKSPTCIGQ